MHALADVLKGVIRVDEPDFEKTDFDRTDPDSPFDRTQFDRSGSVGDGIRTKDAPAIEHDERLRGIAEKLIKPVK